MKFKEKLKFVKKANNRQKKKLVAIITLFSFLILAVTIYNNSYETYLEEGTKKEDNYNYALVPWYDESDIPDRINPAKLKAIEELSKVEHIKEVIDSNARNTTLEWVKIGDQSISGYLYLRGKSEEDLIKMSNGKYSDKYDIVCPQNYYSIDIETNRFTSSSEKINLSNYVGTTLELRRKKLLSEKYESLNLNLIGTFENDKVILNDNYCYASRELILETYYYKLEGSGLEEGWFDLIIEIDDRKYVDEVKKQLKEIGYSLTLCYSVNNEFFEELDRIQRTIIISSIIIILILIIKFNKDEINEKRKNYGILKSIGINDTEYYKLLTLENMTTIFKSFILSLLIALAIYLILKIILSIYPFIFMKYPIKIPFLTLVLFYIAVIIITMITTTFQFSRVKKDSINENLGE